MQLNARFVKHKMKKLRISQKDLSLSLGVSRATVNRWLNGVHDINEYHLAMLATVLGCSPLACAAGNDSVHDLVQQTVEWSFYDSINRNNIEQFVRHIDRLVARNPPTQNKCRYLMTWSWACAVDQRPQSAYGVAELALSASRQINDNALICESMGLLLMARLYCGHDGLDDLHREVQWLAEAVPPAVKTVSQQYMLFYGSAIRADVSKLIGDLRKNGHLLSPHRRIHLLFQFGHYFGSPNNNLSLEYGLMAYDLANKHGLRMDALLCCIFLVNVYSANGELESANRWMKKATRLHGILKRPKRDSLHAVAAKLSLLNGNPRTALAHLEKISGNVNEYLTSGKRLYYGLCLDIYNAIGNTGKAKEAEYQLNKLKPAAEAAGSSS